MSHGYQFLPPLSGDEFANLKEDIAKRGVLVPVEYDGDGNVLDGHHRIRACEELGITDWPRVARSFATEADKRTHARQLNLARRHLTQEQRRALIAEELRENPEKSNRQVAADLQVDDKTVGSIRGNLEATAEIPQLDQTTGADGKSRKKPQKKKPAKRGRPRGKAKPKPEPEPESQHDRDLKMLRNFWDCACTSARDEFICWLGYSVEVKRGAA